MVKYGFYFIIILIKSRCSTQNIWDYRGIFMRYEGKIFLLGFFESKFYKFIKFNEFCSDISCYSRKLIKEFISMYMYLYLNGQRNSDD